MTQVPHTLELDRSVAVLESLGYGHVFGRGVPEDPLFPVEVQLTGQDSHALVLGRLVEKAIRCYLRGLDIDPRYTRAVEAAVPGELWSAVDYADLLVRLMGLVRVS